MYHMSRGVIDSCLTKYGEGFHRVEYSNRALYTFPDHSSWRSRSSCSSIPSHCQMACLIYNINSSRVHYLLRIKRQPPHKLSHLVRITTRRKCLFNGLLLVTPTLSMVGLDLRIFAFTGSSAFLRTSLIQHIGLHKFLYVS